MKIMYGGAGEQIGGRVAGGEEGGAGVICKGECEKAFSLPWLLDHMGQVLIVFVI